MSPKLKGNSNLPYILIGGTFVLYLIIKLAIPQVTIWVQANWVLTIAILAIAVILSILGVILYFKYRPLGVKKAEEYKVEDNSVTVINKPRRTPIPIDMQRQVIGRAKSRCQWEGCKRYGSLEIHHIDGQPSNHRLHNLVYLCPNHHQDAHDRRARTWQIRDWAKCKYQVDSGDR